MASSWFVLLGLACVCAQQGLLCSAAPPLAFSWETVPVFIETSNVTGPFDEAALEAIAKASVFVAEKAYDYPAAGYAEDKLVGLAAELKRRNPKMSLVFYYNSNLDLPDYRLHQAMEQHQPDWWLRTENGTAVVAHQDSGPGAHPPFPYTELYIFDHRVKAVRDAWVNECLNMTQHGFDACMVDRWTRLPRTTPPLPASVLNEWGAARDIATTQLSVAMKQRNAYLIGGALKDDTDGSSDPGWGYTASVKTLMDLAAAGKGILASLSVGCTQNQFESQLAAFLVGCGENHYIGAGSWTTSHTSRAGVAWRPEYDRPLGRPLSLAKRVNATAWQRHFAHGVEATYDEKRHTGVINWNAF